MVFLNDMSSSAIHVTVTRPDPAAEKPTLEELVDADIEEFKKYFCGELRNDSLAPAERSIIKTYLWWKTHQEPARAEENSR